MAITPGIVALANAPGFPTATQSVPAVQVYPLVELNNQQWVLGGTFRGVYWNRFAPSSPAVALASGNSYYDVARNAFLFTDGTGVWWDIGSGARQGN